MVEEEEVTRRVVTTSPMVDTNGAPAVGEAVTTRRVTHSPSGAELLRRIVVFAFALIQGLIVVRLLLLLIDATRGNDLVHFIYTASGWFVGPFDGIVKTDALARNGSVLDIAAIVALVGWSILELIVVAGINIARREA